MGQSHFLPATPSQLLNAFITIRFGGAWILRVQPMLAKTLVKLFALKISYLNRLERAQIPLEIVYAADIGSTRF